MYAIDFAQVGVNIQRQMETKGFTQQSLADELGISKQIMGKIIRGSKTVNVSELTKIASVMGTTADELLRNSGEPFSADNFSFRRNVIDEDILQKINFICLAIDEIHMLEELLDY